MSDFAKPNLPAIFTQALNTLRQFDRDLITELERGMDSIAAILDRGIDFADNVDCRIVSYTSNAVANTQDTLAHTLGKVPTGFIVVDIDKAGIVYRSATADSTNLYLKCSATSASITVLVF